MNHLYYNFKDSEGAKQNFCILCCPNNGRIFTLLYGRQLRSGRSYRFLKSLPYQIKFVFLLLKLYINLLCCPNNSPTFAIREGALTFYYRQIQFNVSPPIWLLTGFSHRYYNAKVCATITLSNYVKFCRSATILKRCIST